MRLRPRSGDIGALGVFGIFSAAAVVGLTAEAYALAGAALLALSVALPVPYAVAIGHVVLLALYPDGPSVATLAAVEAGLIASLLDAAGYRTPTADAVVTLVGVGIVTGATVLALRYDASLWAGAGSLALLLALGAYGLHRYQVVRFARLGVDR